MWLPIYAILLVAALVGTAVALRLALSVRTESGVGYATALAAGVSTIWLLVIVSSFNVVTVSNGTEIANSYPGLGVVGVLGAGVSVLIFGKGSIELLGD